MVVGSRISSSSSGDRSVSSVATSLTVRPVGLGLLRDCGRGVVANVRTSVVTMARPRSTISGPLPVAVRPPTHWLPRLRAAAARKVYRLEQVIGRDRHHHVYLEIAGLAGDGDGGVIPNDLGRHLADRLGDDRVDLARHYRAPRLYLRKLDLADARARGLNPASGCRWRSSSGSRPPSSASRWPRRRRRGYSGPGSGCRSPGPRPRAISRVWRRPVQRTQDGCLRPFPRRSRPGRPRTARLRRVRPG